MSTCNVYRFLIFLFLFFFWRCGIFKCRPASHMWISTRRLLKEQKQRKKDMNWSVFCRCCRGDMQTFLKAVLNERWMCLDGCCWRLRHGRWTNSEERKKKNKNGIFLFFKTRALQLSFASFYLTTVNNLHVSSSNGCRESARTTPSSIKL